jgi:hypothetical protein
MLLALLLFLGAGGLVFAYLGGDSKKTSGPSAVVKTKKFEQSVNRHLMLTNERMELEKQRMDVENQKLMNSSGFSSTRAQKAYTNDDRLDLSTDNRGAEVANEMGRGAQRNEDLNSPHDIVQRELFNEQQAQQESLAYRQQYARQFVENARRGGYEVRLSEDLSRVISVKPIRNPSGTEFNVFKDAGGVGGSQ